MVLPSIVLTVTPRESEFASHRRITYCKLERLEISGNVLISGFLCGHDAREFARKNQAQCAHQTRVVSKR
jgi:hypothetical protein